MRFKPLLFCLFLLSTLGARAQTLLQQQSFEETGTDLLPANGYTASAINSGSTNVYFKRSQVPVAGWLATSNVTGVTGTAANPTGTWLWAAEGVNRTTSPGAKSVTLNSLNVAGKSGLYVVVAMADAASAAQWENTPTLPDQIRVQYRFEGTGNFITIWQFVGNNPGATGRLQQDKAPLDGVADAGGPILNQALTDYRFDIPATGNSLEVRVELDFEGFSEEFAFDNIRVYGAAAASGAPVLANIGGSDLTYTEGQAATQITSGLTVADPDNTTLSSATVRITSGNDASEDRLAFTGDGTTGNIAAAAYNAVTGTLALTSAGSTATLLQWQNALRTVTYQNIDPADASTAQRTVAFTVTDPSGTASNTQSRNINITAGLDPIAPLPYVVTFEEATGEGRLYQSNTFVATPGIQFLRTNANPHNTAANGPTTFSNIATGTYYWFGENTGQADNPSAVKNGTLTTRRISAAGLTGVNFSIRLGASTAATTWQTTDYFKLYYRTGGTGTWTPFASWRGTGTGVAGAGVMRQDASPTAAPGSAAPTGTQLTTALTTFNFPLPALDGQSVVEFQLVLVNTSAGNDFAFDQIEVTASPTVSTAAASSITGNSAVLGGNVTSDGGASVSARGVVYSSTNNTPTIGGSGVTQDSNGSGSGTFSETISGLAAGTTYYVRAYATNAAGTSYGAVQTFTTATTVASIVRASANPTNAGSVSYTVTFANSITGLTTANFSLTTTGLSGASISSVSGSGTTYTVVANTGSGSGTLSLAMSNSTGLTPGVSNVPFTGETYTIDKAGPVVSSVSVPANGLYKTGDQLNFTVNFNEAVVVNTSGGMPGLGLTVGTAGRTAAYSAGSGSSALQFRYTVASGDLDVDGIALANSLALNGGSLQDALGNNASLALNSVATTSGVLVDGVAPTTTISSAAGASGGSTSISPIPFTVTFSESVGATFTAADVTFTNGTLSGFAGSGAVYTFNITPSASGTVTVNVAAGVAADAAGNGNLAASQFSLQYNQPITAAPTVVTPANGAILNNARPTYSGTAPAGSTVTVLVDGATIGTTTATGGSWSLSQATALAQGSHTVRATAQSSGQAVSPNSNTNNFIIDSVAPAAPVVTAPANGSTQVSATPTYTGTAEASATVTVVVDGTAIGTTTATAAGAWSLTQPTALAFGSHTVRARATDAAGNSSPDSNTNTFTISNLATYAGSTADQPNTSRIQAGSTSQEILRVAITVGGGPASPLVAQALTFTTNGSSAPADISAARVYYTGASGTFATTTPFGADVVSPSGSFSVAGAQQLATGVNYFWLVYDVAATATPANVLDATVLSVTLNGTAYVPTVTNPAGNRRIVKASPLAGTALFSSSPATVSQVSFSADATNPAPTLNGPYTQAAWIRRGGGSGSARYYILGNGTGNSAAPFIYVTGNGRIGAGFGTANGAQTAELNSNIIAAGEWNHVVATFNGTTLNVYLNGVSVATAAPGANPPSTRVDFVGSAGTTGNYFSGSIDEVSQWNRALDQAEIRRLRHLTLSGLETGLVSYLQFNDSGTTTTDGVSGTVGTLTGATRVASTAPVSAGTSNLQSVTGTGNYSFTGTNAAINFTSTTGTPYDVVVSRLQGKPLGTQPTATGLQRTYDKAYWIVNKYSSSTFAATITYTLTPADISPADALTPSNLKLFRRTDNSDDVFGTPVSATAASAAAGTVTFPVTSFSQTVIGTFGTSPLPVELTRFEANVQGADALLTWTTAQEKNSAYFEVESSTDGQHFEAVGRVDGQGTTTQRHDYQWLDRTLARYAAAVVYYRLRQVDTDGTASTSVVRTVTVPDGLRSKLALYPNPATRTTHLSGARAGAAVQVFDALGRLVLTAQADAAGQATLSLPEGLPLGVYVVRAGTQAKRLIVE